jgi:TolB-like protein/tetratricopeptide (TPR) repeat protein
MAHSDAMENSIRFDNYEVDPVRRTLTRKGTFVRIQEKPLSILFYLLRHAGRPVSREELHRELWPSGTYVDFDRGLSVVVHKLRTALNDTSNSPRFIETVPGQGYRFIAPVLQQRHEARSEFEVLLVVLPFIGFAPAQEIDHIADAFTEELTAQLSKAVPGRLGVIGRTTATFYRGAGKSIATIGSELRVDYVLEGSIRNQDGILRVVAQLIRVSDQRHVWTESVEHENGNLLRSQIELSDQITRTLSAHLFPDWQQVVRTRHKHRPKEEAYRLYMQGHTYYFPGPDAQSGIMGLKCFHEAISIDPDFAQAHALLSILYTGTAMYDSGIVLDASLPTLALQGKQFAWRAFELAPDCGEANAAVAWQEFQFGWSWQRAEKHFKQALDMNPNFAMARMIYAWALLQMGFQDESRKQILIARDLDPQSVFYGQWEGLLLYYSRDFSRSIQVLERLLTHNPQFGWTNLFLANAYIQTSGSEEAIGLLRNFLRFSEEHTFGHVALIRAHASAGHYGEARRCLTILEESMRFHTVSPYHLAIALASLGEIDRSFDSLEKALQQRSGWIPHMRIDPELDPLRTDCRWKQLIERAGTVKAGGIWSLG